MIMLLCKRITSSGWLIQTVTRRWFNVQASFLNVGCIQCDQKLNDLRLTAGNALTAVVAAGIAQEISPIAVPPELEDAVDLQRDVVKQVILLAVPGSKDASCAMRRHVLIIQNHESCEPVPGGLWHKHTLPQAAALYERQILVYQTRSVSGLSECAMNTTPQSCSTISLLFACSPACVNGTRLQTRNMLLKIQAERHDNRFAT